MISRKQFIKSQGATCLNWNWSWSFKNQKKKIIIFGAWDRLTQGNISLIFTEDWEISYKGKRNAGYSQSREHIRLIEEEGYHLKTFPIIYSEERFDKYGNGPAKIKGFTPKLSDKILVRTGNNWYASDDNITVIPPNEMFGTETYAEGGSQIVPTNKYERNPAARKKCIEYYGFECAVCSFNFEKVYGEIGKNYIHVHHIKPLGEIKKEYKLDPIKDLVPICPNCHAMIHRTQPAKSIEQLRKQLGLK